MLTLSDDILSLPIIDPADVTDFNRETYTATENKLDVVFSDLLKHNGSHVYYYEDNTKNTENIIQNGELIINVSNLMKETPTWVTDRFDRILLNIYRLYGIKQFHPQYYKHCRRMFMASGDYEDAYETCRAMTAYGYCKEDKEMYLVSKQGWDRIQLLLQKDTTSRTAFIAMAFKDGDEIFRALSKAITEAGYRPIRVDQVEHNNQIVPEIFNQIEKCRFLVMDLSIPNYGAYYEAGIARGMGKDTILTCAEDKFHGGKEDRPHFDVAQQSTIVWKNYDDLEQRLLRRIQTTIG